MQSNKFLKIAKEVAEKDKVLFDTLIEFEKTKKIRTKSRLNFTIDKSIASRFKKFCRDKGYNMSAKVEKAMKDIIEKEGY
ncbi:hypothetical protein KY361_07745 [Candidatus Woesearchaeota archaeon]|nr:hypothetical protein [Candidatus Woesearchaeota archaeon]